MKNASAFKKTTITKTIKDSSIKITSNSEFVKNFIPTQYRGLLQKTKLAFGDKRNFSPVQNPPESSIEIAKARRRLTMNQQIQDDP